jgi:hypothetical protein
MGPNFKKFVIRKMSRDAIPDGGGLGAGIEFLTTPGKMASGLHAATEWCDAAVKAVRLAGEPNPWKNANEEEIAGELVRRIEERTQKRKIA